MTPVAAAFSANVRRLRKEQQLSQKALAAMAGIHATTVSFIEGGGGASLDVAAALCGALGASLDAMVTPGGTS